LPNDAKEIDCDACGESYSRGRLRCPHCGEKNDSLRHGIPEAARTPSRRVRLWGLVWIAAGILLVAPILWLAAQMPVSNIRWLPRRWQSAGGILLFLPLIAFYKGWVEVVTGIRCVVMFKLGGDPFLGWREFASWLFLVASLVVAFAIMIGITMLLEPLGMVVP
jgi:hypothetical protein